MTEYAKDLVFSKDFYRLKDQLYILAKQHHPMFKLKNQVDVLVNDGPFLLGLVYLQDEYGFPKEYFEKFLLGLWNSYNHINIFLERDVDSYGFQEYGRAHTLEQAQKFDVQILDMMDRFDIPYHKVKVGEKTVQHVLEIMVGRRD